MTSSPRPRRLRRALRVLGLIPIGLVLLALGAALALPVYFRGPRLGRLLERLAPPLCGRLAVASARLETTVVFDLLLGWPTGIVIEGAALHGPAGDVVVGARAIEARLRLALRARTLEVERLALASPVFRLEQARGRSPLQAALVAAPSRELAGRCPPPLPGAPTGRSPGARTEQGAAGTAGAASGPARLAGAAVRIGEVRLADAILVLDLPDWGLTLDGASATGTATLTAGGDSVPQLRFDARRIDATRGGTLRVGPVRLPWSTTVPFGRVRIDRVAIDDASPGTLLLDLSGASTGRSTLAGHARFDNVFSWQEPGARDWMAIDARWTQVSDGFSAIRAAWRPALSFLDLGGLDLEAKVNGPYTRPSASLRVRGAELDVAAHVDPDLEAGVEAAFERLDVRPFLPGSLRPALGGILTGRLAASGAVGTSVGQAHASLDELDLRLARSSRGPFPAQVRLRKQGEPEASGPELADVILGLVELEAGVLRLGDVRGRIYGGEVEGGLTVALVDPRGAPQRAHTMIEPGFDGRLRVRGLDLGLAVPAGVASGVVDLGLRVHGPGDALAVGLTFGRDRRVAILSEVVVLPPGATARILDGERLEIPRLTITRLAGGAVHAEGSVVADGDLRATVGIGTWPLGGLPGVRGSGVPIGGQLTAALRLSGATASPLLEGEIALDDVRLGRTRLGSGGLTLRRLADGPGDRGARGATPRFGFAGGLVDRVTVQGQASLGREPSVEATIGVHGLTVDVADLPGVALPSGLEAARATVSAKGVVSADPRAVAFSGSLEAIELLAAPRAGRAFVLASARPAPVTIAPTRATLGPLALTGPGIDLTIDAEGDAARFTTEATGSVHLARLSGWLPPSVRHIDGRVTIAAEVAGGAGQALSGRGQLEITQPIGIVPERFRPGVTMRAGRIELQPERLAVHDLQVETFGAQATVAAEVVLPRGGAPATARWSVDGQARLDELARFLAPVVADARGTTRVSVRGTGPLLAPTLAGHVDLLGASALLSAFPTRVHASDARLVLTDHGADLRGLRLTADNGQLEVGPASLTLLDLRPLRFSVVAPIATRDLAVTPPRAGVALDDLDVRARVTAEQNANAPLRVGGSVQIERAALRLRSLRGSPSTRGGAPSPRLTPGSPRTPAAGPTLDVQLVAPPGAVTLALPWLPDPAVGANCRIVGSLARPKTAGTIVGSNWFTRLGLWLYDVFAGKHVRDCQVPP